MVQGVAQPKRVGVGDRVEQRIAHPEGRTRLPARGPQVGPVSVLEGGHQRFEKRHPASVAAVAEHSNGDPDSPRYIQRRLVQLRVLPARRASVAAPGAGSSVGLAHARPVGGGNGGTTPLPWAAVLRSSVSVMRFRSDPPTRMRSE